MHSTVLPNFQFQFSGKIHLAFVAHAFYSYPIPIFFFRHFGSLFLSNREQIVSFLR